MDMISSASIDVVATASPYDETRKEYSGGIDYLSDKTMMGFAYIRQRGRRLSREHGAFRHQPGLLRRSDDAGHFLRARLERRHDEWRSHVQGTYALGRTGESICRRSSRRIMVMNFGYEGITDDGYLHDPYRSARYLDPSSCEGIQLRSRSDAGHEDVERMGDSRHVLPAVSRIDACRVPLLQRYVGSRRLEHRIRLRSTAVLGVSRWTSTTATTRRVERTSTATCFRTRTRRTSSAATKNCPSSRRIRSVSG